MEFKKKFKVVPDQSLAYLQYKIVDANKNELNLQEEKDIDSSASKSKNKASIRGEEE